MDALRRYALPAAVGAIFLGLVVALVAFSMGRLPGGGGTGTPGPHPAHPEGGGGTDPGPIRDTSPQPARTEDVVPPAAPVAGLRGVVRREEDDRPVEGAEVVFIALPATTPGASRWTARADYMGVFVLRDLPARQSLGGTVSAEGLAPLVLEPIELAPDEARDLGVILLGTGGPVAGRVLAASGGVAGALVRAWSVDPQDPYPGAVPSAEVRSGPEGAFRFPRLAPGTYHLAAEAAGHAPAFLESLSVLAAGREGLELRLEAESRIAGTVRDGRGQPLAGASVTAWIRDPRPVETGHTAGARTDREGRFVLERLRETAYDVQATAPGHARAVAEGVRAGPAGREGRAELVLDAAGTLVGRVVDRDRGGPVAGAMVDAWLEGWGEAAATDAEGRFRIETVPPGMVTVQAWAQGYAELRRGVEVAAGRETAVELALGAGLSIAGRVTDAATGVGLAGAQVSAQAGGGQLQSAETDEGGAYRLSGLPEGPLTVEARAPGYIPDLRGGVLAALAGAQDFALRRGGRILGLVRDATSRPIEGAQVGALADGDDRPPTLGAYLDRGVDPGETLTGAEGRFVLDGLDSGFYRVVATHVGHAPGEVRGVEVRAGRDTADVELRLGAGATVTGRVTAGGSPLEGALVYARPTEGAPDSPLDELGPPPVSTGADGRYRLENLPAGRLDLVAEADGYLAASRALELEEGAHLEAGDLELGSGLSIAGQVVDERGAPLRGAMVSVYGAAAGGGSGTTSPEGRFEVRGLGPGVYTLQAWAEGFANRVVEGVSAGDLSVHLVLGRNGRIEGQLLAAGGRPETAFSFVLRSEGYTYSAPADAAHDGRFVLAEVPPGVYELEVSVPGYAPARVASVAVAAGEVTRGVVVRLAQGGTVRGVVVAGRERRPVEGATVMVESEVGVTAAGVEAVRTGPDGEFTLRNVPEGVHTLRVVHPDHAEAFVAGVRASEGGVTQGLEVLLSQGGLVRGRVLRSEDQRPVAGAAVYVGDTYGETDAQGVFAVRAQAGLYTIRVWAEGRQEGEVRDVRVPADGDVDLGEIRLGPSTGRPAGR